MTSLTLTHLFYYCVVLATLLVISAFTLVYYWSLESWKFHPFVKKIKANLMNNEWSDVVNDVNIELRRPDKLIIQTGSINKVIVSDNWILQVGQWPWNFNLAHKSNVQLELVKSVHLALHRILMMPGVGFSTSLSKFMTLVFIIPLKFGSNP